jgi:hypothetical protein
VPLLLLSEPPEPSEPLFLTFPLPLPLPPLLGLGVGGGGSTGGHNGSCCGGRGAATAEEDTLLLRGGVERGGLPLGHRVVHLDLLEFEVIADGVEGGERLQPLDEDFDMIEPLVQAL